MHICEKCKLFPPSSQIGSPVGAAPAARAEEEEEEEVLHSLIGFSSCLFHEMTGAGLPRARQFIRTRIPSLASVSELLSSSTMSGGTGREREMSNQSKK